MVLFGQIVIGPPGSGKTTYVYGMSMFLSELERKSDIVNLDFANDKLPYTPTIDVRDLITIESVMNEHSLGPNGGLVYCFEYLVEHLDWLIEKLNKLESYYIFLDFPGQVELFTHYKYVETIIKCLKDNDCRLCSVHLVDSFYCSQPSTFISAVLLSSCTMLRLALPHVNVLTKIDILPQYGQLPFNFDFFTEGLNLTLLTRYIDSPFLTEEEIKSREKNGFDDDNEENEEKSRNTDFDGTNNATPSHKENSYSKRNIKKSKFCKMTEAICDVLSDMSLVSFLPLNIQDAQTVGRVLAQADKANGYSFAAAEMTEYEKLTSDDDKASFESRPSQLFRLASQDTELSYFKSLDVYEKYNTNTNEDFKS